nr:UDP-glycosyltransferase 90A1-like [Tanacetum cinerariifolium]
MITRSQVGTFKPNPRFHGHTSHISPLSKSSSVALSDPHWRDAMYDEYNALIKNATIRTVLSLVLARNWPVHQLDVKNAFLNAVFIWIEIDTSCLVSTLCGAMDNTSPSSLHVVLFPFMAKGHTIPMLQLARLLLRRNATVTIFTTPANHPYISTSLSDTSTSIISLPFPNNIPGVPPGVESMDTLPSLSLFFPFVSSMKLMQPDFEKAVQSENGVHPTLDDGFEERVKEKGVVVREWVNQREILEHEIVKGFVSHCGWNSVLESICAGVPILAWPLSAEQPLNAKFVVDEIKIGVRVETLDGSVTGFVKGEGLEKKVKELMEGEKGKEVRKKVAELRNSAVKAVEEGGSAWRSLNELIDELQNKSMTS